MFEFLRDGYRRVAALYVLWTKNGIIHFHKGLVPIMFLVHFCSMDLSFFKGTERDLDLDASSQVR